MKKFKFVFLIIFMLFFVVGCSNSDKKLVNDTTELLTDSGLPPEVSFSTNLPNSMRVGEELDAYASYENNGGGTVRAYLNLYKNNEALLEHQSGCTVASTFKNGIKGGNTLYAFDLINNAGSFSFENAKCDDEKTFTSPGTYKYEFIFYDCADLIEKLGANDSCSGMAVAGDRQDRFSKKGVEPIKIEIRELKVSN